MGAYTHTSSAYPQIRICSIRMMKPETCEGLLNKLVEIPGIRRILLHGQNIPKVIPYGPARGMENKTTMKRDITVGDTTCNIRMLVGDVILELDDECTIGLINRICNDFFVKFGFIMQKGIFIKPSMTMVDYAKYGPNADPSLIGMVDPRSKERPVMVVSHEEQDIKTTYRCENNMLEG
ncbi:methyl-coenzyme M reductase operon protein D [Methanospirillum purgamenti]|jgi:methyl-coenzyme M reductase subunit D|uniref:Methyl-coenzyme M reductase operon protein D n=1 Tax=Methanospirillum hungatei TaxID=2203 RepID=A0A8F5VP38_METHU|nr:methyl-coenzyme M reductase operon protein D [Methanospirillum hungatei]QXO95801.1 methyl-coenzyme M reductase operon protein D [Methanospirillum hungatei]